MAAGDEWLTAATWMLRASLAENDGDHAAQSAAAEEALRRFRALGERWGLSSTLRVIGGVRVLDGDLDGGAAAFTEALAALEGPRLAGRRVPAAAAAGRPGGPPRRPGRGTQQLRGRPDPGPDRRLGAERGDRARLVRLVRGNRGQHGPGRRAVRRGPVADRRDRGQRAASPAPGRLGGGRGRPGRHRRGRPGAGGAARGRRVRERRRRRRHAAARRRRDGCVELALARGNPARAAELLGAAAVVRGTEDPTSVQFRGSGRAAAGGPRRRRVRGLLRPRQGAAPRPSALPFLDPASL